MKLIKVEKCSNCNYIGFFNGGFCFKNGQEPIPNINTIPSWCPLEDYKEDDHEALQ